MAKLRLLTALQAFSPWLCCIRCVLGLLQQCLHQPTNACVTPRKSPGRVTMYYFGTQEPARMNTADVMDFVMVCRKVCICASGTRLLSSGLCMGFQATHASCKVGAAVLMSCRQGAWQASSALLQDSPLMSNCFNCNSRIYHVLHTKIVCRKACMCAIGPRLLSSGLCMRFQAMYASCKKSRKSQQCWCHAGKAPSKLLAHCFGTHY